MAKIFKNYKKGKEAGKIAIAYTIHQTMSPKDKFGFLKEKLNRLNGNLGNYQTASANAKLGGSDRTALKNGYFEAIMDDLDGLSIDVELMSRTDEDALTDSGFQSVKARSKTKKEPVAELPVPIGFKVVNIEKSGAVKASCNDIDDAVLFQVSYLVNDETVWVADDFSDDSTSIILSGFKKFTRLKVRMRAISATGVVSDWTNAVEVGVD